MAGMLSELRRKLSGNRQKSTYSTYSNAVRRPEPRIVKQVPVIQEPLQPDDAEDSLPEASELCHTNTFERTQDIVSKDDFLLQQIDEFRDRAQQLQNLMNSREEELRQMEEERQQEEERQMEQKRQLEELRQQEEEQQRQMEELRQMREQEMTLSEDQMQQIEQLLLKRDEHADRQAGQQMQQIEQILLKRDENTEKLTAEVERKIDAMIAKVGAKLDELDASVRESTAGESSANRQRAEELRESLEQIQSQLESLKAELSDKVHKENVICYRNIQELFKDLEAKVDRMSRQEPIKRKLDSTKKLVIVTMIFSLINFIGMVGMLLLSLGVFAI